MPDDNQNQPIAADHFKAIRKTMSDIYAAHNEMMDRYRSIDDIVKEGSNPSANSRFTSSSSRNPDPNYKTPGSSELMK